MYTLDTTKALTRLSDPLSQREQDALTALDFTPNRNVFGGLPFPFFEAAEQGYNDAAGVVTQTVDGRPLADLWTEFTRTVALLNARRQTIIDLLTFPVQNLLDDVPQISSTDFERASEFGVPKSARARINYFTLGYDFEWYDVATRYTWKFLIDATAQQVEAIHQEILEADNRLVFNKVMATVFNNANSIADIRGSAVNVYKFYNGDGVVPPPYNGNTFDGTENHYLVGGNTVVDSGDIEQMLDKLVKKGYSATNGNTIVLMVNSVEGNQIRRFRMNTVNNNGANALYDFVPAVNQPPTIVPNTTGLLGNQPSGNYGGLTVIGQYGPVLVVQEDYIPAGYMFMFATGGAANLANPIGLREHSNTALRGLQLLPGNRSNYPLVDAYYRRGFGTGVRQRGAGVVMQIKASGSYATPVQYVGI